MIIEQWKTTDVKPYEKNPRVNDQAVDAVASSISEFGWQQPIVVDTDGVIIAGHTRWKAAKKLGMDSVPVVVARNLTPEQVRAYRLADNRTGELAEWDWDLLAEELDAIEDIDMSELGFDASEMEIEDPVSTGEGDVSEDVVPEAEEVEPTVRRGQIWKLGEHRLMCGDSTSKEDIDRLMCGEKACLCFTDPPYGMGKESEGILNDNLNQDDLLDFNKRWIPLSFDSLTENGSWYCWGIDEPLMDIYGEIIRPMQKANKVAFRNLITWKKESDNPTMLYNGACSSGNRSYYTNEKCLFVMCGAQEINTNQDNYFKGWEPVRQYLAGEAERVGLTPRRLQEICGVGMYSHWFTKSQFTFITEEHYKQLQDYYKCDAFKKEYDALKKEYYSTRAYFDGTQSQCIDVWVHDVTSQKERENTGGHASPKPISLCSRAIKTSSREGDIVLDVFGGSGSTLIACEQTGRRCRMMELDPRYCDVIIARWENLTGKKAELIEGSRWK